MTKNASCDNNCNVRVFSADGEEIGLTYPKRARGLVKKGRAQYVNDCDIRLIASDVPTFTEDTMMDNNTNINLTKEQEAPAVNKLYFNARDWHFNKDCPKNVGNRSFMQGPDGVIAEAFTIGNWGWDWTEICTKSLILPKNTLHSFTFWLNGGENDQSNEICRFEVIFNNDYENRYTYNLNRNFIKPLKKVNGWELYEIPFVTGDNEYTELRFVAQRAYMTVLSAVDISEYENLPDSPDKFEGIRPQRHNIIFADGFPTNTWYSTRALEQQINLKENSSNAQSNSRVIPNPPNPENIRESIENIGSGIDFEGLKSEVINTIRNSVRGSDLSEVEINEIIADAVQSIDDAAYEVRESLAEALDDIRNSFEG